MDKKIAFARALRMRSKARLAVWRSTAVQRLDSASAIEARLRQPTRRPNAQFVGAAMMKTRRPRSQMSGVLAGLLIVCLVASSCQPLDLIDSALPGDGEESQTTPAAVQPTVRDLAADLDSLERQIERYGSVVAQQPSVWGQARLTMYREEFEKEMAAQLNNFHATLQGSLSRSDQAYAADALALSYTAQAAAAGNPSGGGKKGASSSSSSSSASTAGGGGGGGGGGTGASPPASTSSPGSDSASVPGHSTRLTASSATRLASRARWDLPVRRAPGTGASPSNRPSTSIR
jgi:uncharacterized membrane protein YgcG